jgi:hypothetical protein
MGTTEEDRPHATEASPWMRPYVPPRFLRSGQLRTIAGNAAAAPLDPNSFSSRLRNSCDDILLC